MLNIYIGFDSGLNEYKREVYNLLDLMGDLGGVLEVMIFVCGIMLYPISEHSFVLKALNLLYLVKSNDSKRFAKRKKDGKGEIHRIKLSMKDSIKLFFMHNLTFVKWPDMKLLALYKKGTAKIDKDFNLEELIRNVKRLMVMVGNNLASTKED